MLRHPKLPETPIALAINDFASARSSSDLLQQTGQLFLKLAINFTIQNYSQPQNGVVAASASSLAPALAPTTRYTHTKIRSDHPQPPA
jgi:hypothetical protein